MAAVTENIGRQDRDFADLQEEHLVQRTVGMSGLAGFGAARQEATLLSNAPPLAASVVELTRLAFTRRALEKALADPEAGRQILVEVDNREKAGVMRGTLAFRVDPLMPKLAAPWTSLTDDALGQKFALFTENSKMACATWDLPAGAAVIGGTCPGAMAGQPIVPSSDMRSATASVAGTRVLYGTGQTVQLRETICATCYAAGGAFQNATAQLKELVALRWAQAMLRTPDEFVRVVSDALLRYPHKVQHGIKTVRLHSSGDFFSPAYADMWIAVANEVARRDPLISFWAPSRTWAARGWVDYWRAAYATKIQHPEKFVVRPSAYHFGDFAPAPRVLGSPSAGSTSVYAHDVRKPQDGRFDWICEAYKVVDAAHSCSFAADPRLGKNPEGCRACWTRPDLRIMYMGH